jgi:hypothetical protein
MAARKKMSVKRSAKVRELDVVVSFPRELEKLTREEQSKLSELAKIFEARTVFSVDVPSEVMVKVEKR